MSSVKEKENGKKNDDEISLSGLSSNDDDPGEITETFAKMFIYKKV